MLRDSKGRVDGPLPSRSGAATPMFDAYHKWLGIPPDRRPPYAITSCSASRETSRDAEVIESAAIRQMAYVRNFQAGAHAQDCAASSASCRRPASPSATRPGAPNTMPNWPPHRHRPRRCSRCPPPRVPGPGDRRSPTPRVAAEPLARAESDERGGARPPGRPSLVPLVVLIGVGLIFLRRRRPGVGPAPIVAGHRQKAAATQVLGKPPLPGPVVPAGSVAGITAAAPDGGRLEIVTDPARREGLAGPGCRQATHRRCHGATRDRAARGRRQAAAATGVDRSRAIGSSSRSSCRRRASIGPCG